MLYVRPDHEPVVCRPKRAHHCFGRLGLKFQVPKVGLDLGSIWLGGWKSEKVENVLKFSHVYLVVRTEKWKDRKSDLNEFIIICLLHKKTIENIEL